MMCVKCIVHLIGILSYDANFHTTDDPTYYHVCISSTAVPCFVLCISSNCLSVWCKKDIGNLSYAVSQLADEESQSSLCWRLASKHTEPFNFNINFNHFICRTGQGASLIRYMVTGVDNLTVQVKVNYFQDNLRHTTCAAASKGLRVVRIVQ
jgi:hypothetical protein